MLRPLRDPTIPQAQADAIEQSMPRILWLAGNVHGTEESGADAGLQVLYDLADRTDCAAKAITSDSGGRDHADPEPRRSRASRRAATPTGST